MGPETILSTNRKELLRRLARANERLSWPAVYSSREVMAEIQRDRQLLLDELRRLPLAS